MKTTHIIQHFHIFLYLPFPTLHIFCDTGLIQMKTYFIQPGKGGSRFSVKNLNLLIWQSDNAVSLRSEKAAISIKQSRLPPLVPLTACEILTEALKFCFPNCMPCSKLFLVLLKT